MNVLTNSIQKSIEEMISYTCFCTHQNIEKGMCMVEIRYCTAVCNTEKLQKLGPLPCIIPVTIIYNNITLYCHCVYHYKIIRHYNNCAHIE